MIRRGQTFEIDVIFDRPFNEDTDDVQLVFEIGDFPQMSKGKGMSKGECPRVTVKRKLKWAFCKKELL